MDCHEKVCWFATQSILLVVNQNLLKCETIHYYYFPSLIVRICSNWFSMKMMLFFATFSFRFVLFSTRNFLLEFSSRKTDRWKIFHQTKRRRSADGFDRSKNRRNFLSVRFGNFSFSDFTKIDRKKLAERRNFLEFTSDSDFYFDVSSRFEFHSSTLIDEFPFEHLSNVKLFLEEK